MARSFARLMLSVWRDDEFVALTAGAQRAYFLLISQPSLSFAGCLPLQPTKWAKLATDTTSATIVEAIDELVATRFVLIDDDTEEVLVRSFIRHDGGATNTNIGKAIVTAIGKIDSRELRTVAQREFDTARTKHQVTGSDEDPSEDPGEHRDQDAPEAAPQGASEATYILNPSSLPLNPSPAPLAIVGKPTGPCAGFEEFYARFPNHKAAGAAERAYTKALKAATHEQIMTGLERMLPELNASKARGFCPYPASWLNAARWNDQPSTITQPRPATRTEVRTSARTRLDERLARTQQAPDHPTNQHRPIIEARAE